MNASDNNGRQERPSMRTQAERFATANDQIVRDYMVEHSPYEIFQYYEETAFVNRDEVSEIAMSLSLCPIHFVDWAICFDDSDPECSQVRDIFPVGHDT